ncbi:MAG: class I SAM-dependent methyltransferase, partial [Mycobacteriales bacterium]
MPVPPPELAAYVAACSEGDPVALYLEQGAVFSRGLLDLFPRDLDLAGARILDFGCGSGRFLRHLINAGTGAVFEGADIDADCIDWLHRHLPPPHRALRNRPLPPLPRPDGHYKLIYAMSVFSHLTDAWAAWLCELHRLLTDDGVLIATVIGQAAGPIFGEEPWIDDRIGMLVLGPGRPWVAGGPMVLHSHWWLREHWGRAFTVLDIASGGRTTFGQDVIVLRKRPGEPTPAELERIDPAEPREISALAYALRRSHADSAQLNTRHDDYSRAYQLEAARRETLAHEYDELRLANLDLAHRLQATVEE